MHQYKSNPISQKPVMDALYEQGLLVWWSPWGCQTNLLSFLPSSSQMTLDKSLTLDSLVFYF